MALTSHVVHKTVRIKLVNCISTFKNSYSWPKCCIKELHQKERHQTQLISNNVKNTSRVYNHLIQQTSCRWDKADWLCRNIVGLLSSDREEWLEKYFSCLCLTYNKVVFACSHWRERTLTWLFTINQPELRALNNFQSFRDTRLKYKQNINRAH